MRIQKIIKFGRSDIAALLLIITSSILLGIWALVSTIALRNCLLFSGGVIGLIYWISFFIGSSSWAVDKRLLLIQFAPLLLIWLFFLWILFHYFFLSHEPLLQLAELKSTWLRSLLAVIIGSATGLALNKSRNYLPILWAGLSLSFIVLLYQYIPKAVAMQTMFATVFYGNYIYETKYSGVLAGSILFAGLLGMWVDYVYFQLHTSSNPSKNFISNKKGVILVSIYTLFGIILTLFSFVFIFDSKVGVGSAIIITLIWFFIAIIHLLKNIFSSGAQKNRSKLIFKAIIFSALATLVLGWFVQMHAKNNPGWESLLSDIYVSAQIDKHKNWHNTPRFGFPERDDGAIVRGNTYERVSWALVGLRVLNDEPLGYGTLRSFPRQMMVIIPDFSGSPYTHSAWIDIGLTFGYPGLAILFMIFGIILKRAILGAGNFFAASVFTLSVSIFILYAVGEYGFQHGIEVLFYFAAYLSALSLTLPNILLEESR